jgi:hypothetical protein
VTSDDMDATVARLHREGTALLVAEIRAGWPRPRARDATREANTFDLVSDGEEPMAGERQGLEGHVTESISCTIPRGTLQGCPPGLTPAALATEGDAQRGERRHLLPRKVNAARRYGDEYLRCADTTNSGKLPPEFWDLREESMALYRPEGMVYAHTWVQASHFCENGGLGLFMEVVAGGTLGAGTILGIYESVDNRSLHLTYKEAKQYFRASDYVLADPPQIRASVRRREELAASGRMKRVIQGILGKPFYSSIIEVIESPDGPITDQAEIQAHLTKEWEAKFQHPVGSLPHVLGLEAASTPTALLLSASMWEEFL